MVILDEATEASVRFQMQMRRTDDFITSEILHAIFEELGAGGSFEAFYINNLNFVRTRN